ncbi:hypothetical protein [Blastopirellula marina]|uniref:Uncharacterized protein n=1 Tax=Blastopirellula marina TaxID=124 RepID=A0A2S8F6I5_9BACT|nr:hypothetical protein [Blastopirellula marina]PQO27771.1 hypothetical protein C5Y98_27145 [Blastopirellula marina]PTL41511.1 hypothetical protein C5Y97_27160 [Blastopirellula marina]
MHLLDVTKILGSRERPMFLLAELWVNRKTARDFYGAEPVIAEEPGLGLADYWGVQFDCGMKIFFEFFHLSSECGLIYSDMPCVQHLQRHLRLWHDALQIFPEDVFELDRNSMIQRFHHVMPELLELHAYQVWRQGDDGNPMPMGDPTTRRDAQCWSAELESSMHKQIYWVSRCDDVSSKTQPLWPDGR